MKKLLTICLILTTLLASFSLVPTAEDAPAADPLAENLIIHYDFEGDDIETQLKDKATGGSSSDDLAYNGSADNRANDISISNGVLHYKGTAGMIADFRGEDGTTTGADLPNATTNEFTFYMSFKVYGDGASKGGFRDLFNVYTLSSTNGISARKIRLYFGNCNANETKDLSFVCPDTATDGGSKTMKMTTLPYGTATAPSADFTHIAVTTKYNESTSKWDYVGYLSVNGGKTYYAVMEFSAANPTDYMATANAICLGNRNVNTNVAVEYDYDDFRVYNKALTDAQLTAINFPVTEDDKTDNSSEENTTTKAPDTTKVPDTTTAPTDGAITTAPTEEKSGCGSTVVLGFSTVAVIAAGAWITIKKKED